MLNNQLRLHPAGAPTQVGNLLSHMGNSPKFSDCKCREKKLKFKSQNSKDKAAYIIPNSQKTKLLKSKN